MRCASWLSLLTMTFCKLWADALPGPASRMSGLVERIEARRAALNVPGMAVAIVKDDRVVLAEGFGRRDAEKESPVTADTLFAIGSTTKALTAMAAMMAVDAGKLSLDDAPRKYLPFFKLQDGEADAKVTIRDLLCHRSGLMRTDLLWMPGKLSRREVIEALAQVKPTAKLGQAWQYQNVTFSAAGECVAAAEKTTWEEDIRRKILQPLGMKQTVFTIQEMQASDDFAMGYSYPTTRPAKAVAMRDLASIAPAGAINSGARDMAQWVRLMLGRGQIDGKRLVSEKSFDQLVAKQQAMSQIMHYGLGWMVWKYKGRDVWEHGGGIDGFGALVTIVPSEKLGIVILHSGVGSPIAQQVREIIWAELIEQPKATTTTVASTGPSTAPTVAAQAEAGAYRLGGMRAEVAWDGERLTFSVPGQPAYPLQHASGRKYKLGPPCPDGFFITFRPAKDDPQTAEAFLQQPHGDFVLTRENPTTGPYTGPFAELIGEYEAAGGAVKLRIGPERGKVSLIADHQPPYALVEKSKDAFSLAGLPATFELTVQRDAGGKVTGITTTQPGVKLALSRVVDASAISADELMAKVIEAAGGEKNLRKHKSLTMKVTLNLPNQGVSGTGTIWSAAPCSFAQRITLRAMEKELGETWLTFDGSAGMDRTSFMPSAPFTPEQAQMCRRDYDFHGMVNWKALYSSVTVRAQKLANQDVWAVTKKPAKGEPVVEYYSITTLQMVRREFQMPLGAGLSERTVETMEKHRSIDGVMVPMSITIERASIGTATLNVEQAEFDRPISEGVFQGRP